MTGWKKLTRTGKRERYITLEAIGITDKELADIIGVSHGYLRLWKYRNKAFLRSTKVQPSTAPTGVKSSRDQKQLEPEQESLRMEEFYEKWTEYDKLRAEAKKSVLEHNEWANKLRKKKLTAKEVEASDEYKQMMKAHEIGHEKRQEYKKVKAELKEHEKRFKNSK